MLQKDNIHRLLKFSPFYKNILTVVLGLTQILLLILYIHMLLKDNIHRLSGLVCILVSTFWKLVAIVWILVSEN